MRVGEVPSEDVRVGEVPGEDVRVGEVPGEDVEGACSAWVYKVSQHGENVRGAW